jgi:hypothetical protein
VVTRSTEIEYPIEAIIEIVIASFLDTEAFGFIVSLDVASKILA